MIWKGTASRANHPGFYSNLAGSGMSSQGSAMLTTLRATEQVLGPCLGSSVERLLVRGLFVEDLVSEILDLPDLAWNT